MSDTVEYAAIEALWDAAHIAGLGAITTQLLSGYTMGANCSTGSSAGCIYGYDSSPKGTRAVRNGIFWFVFDLPGIDLQTTGLEARVTHSGVDASAFFVSEWLWWGQSFTSTAAFVAAFRAGQLTVPPAGAVPATARVSSFEKTTATSSPSPPQLGPQHFEPAGRRFAVQGSHVTWMKWSFAFGVRATAGLGLFNVLFGGERIAYEISLQEAGAFYSGARTSALQQQTMYLDSSWSMGMLSLELLPGVDCPRNALMLPTTQYTSSGPATVEGSVCIFEHDTATPLRRHYEMATGDTSAHYGSWAGGLQGHVLVVRTVTTVYNYDYIIDMLFNRNGVIEVAVTPAGYPQATYYNAADPTTASVGNPMTRWMMGTAHDHFFNYKARALLRLRCCAGC